MGVTVDELLKEPFSTRSMEEKQNIVLDGKPRPPLKMSAVTINETDGSIVTKHFDPALYDEVEWLTGCDLRGSVFCWPCLLFKAGDLWSAAGISDLILLEEGMLNHEKSSSHAEAVSGLKSFTQHNIKVTTEKLLIQNQQVKELVQRNRDIIKLLTESVCGIVTRDLPTRLKRKSWCRLELDTCVKTLEFLRIYNIPYTNHINEAISLLKKTPHLLDDVVDAVTEVLKVAIMKDMQTSTYASIIISEHSEAYNSSQISTIIRYLKDGKVFERFIGFKNMGKRSTPAAIYNHILKVVQEFGISDRFLALSIDGGVFETPQELTHLIFQLKTNFPHTYFVPSHFHGLHHVLRQSLSSYKECFKFFKTFSALEEFFKTNSNIWNNFKSFMLTKIPALKNSNVLGESQILKLANVHRGCFIMFFNYLEQNSKLWGKNDIAKACGFIRFLKDFESVFLLKVFDLLYEHTDTLETSLRSKTPENAFGFGITTVVIGDLALEKDEGFDGVWKMIKCELAEYQNEEPPNKILKRDETAEMTKYKELFKNIFQRSISEIQTRFNKLNILQFCRLLTLQTTNLEKGGSNQKQNFPKSYRGDISNDYLQRLMEVQRPFFEEDQLKNEIILLSQNPSVFVDKSDYEILKLFREMNLQNVFRNLYRLAELILTMPFRMPPSDGTPNKLEKIINFSYTPEKLLTPGDTSVLYVENDLLQYIKRDVFFYDELINKFYDINKSMELIQK